MPLIETLVGAAFGALLGTLLNKMASNEFFDFFKKWKFDQTLLPQLEFAVLTVGAVLSDAEGKQITNPSVKLWFDAIKDAVYDAEDLLDEIIDKMKSNKTGNSKKEGHLKKDLESKVKEIIKLLEFIAQQKDVLALGGGSGLRFPSTSLVDETKIFGRDNDKQVIRRFLLPPAAEINANANGNEIPVIGIVGMPGIGKTTLAQLLFNDEEVKQKFKNRAWVHVSEKFDILKITKTIYESLRNPKGVDFHSEDLSALQDKLQEELKDKKLFLLVLDDIWNVNFVDWDVLQRPFKGVDVQSRIIVTTCSSKVASIMRADYIHHLSCLSGDYCWSIFRQYAFRPGIELSEFPEIQEIGKQIVDKCNGLPLAAKTLGALLYSEAIDEWIKVLHSEIWELPADKSIILETLRLSYTQLPSHLKRCFAYCSIFPKGYVFEKEHLIMLWKAEGLLPQPRNEQLLLEDVGDEYFHELLSRSFFQQIRDRHGKPCFIMNAFFRDLAQTVGGEFCFMSEKRIVDKAPRRVRHLSFILGKLDVPKILDVLKGDNHLRTFLTLKSLTHFGSHYNTPASYTRLKQKFSRLRVLSLKNHNMIHLDDFIGELKYLRYLDLSFTEITKLSQHVCTLYNLETLLLSGCEKLIELHENMKNLTKLQHLDISGSTNIRRMPPEFGKLKNLRTLNAFLVALSQYNTNTSHVKELKELSDLRTLSIQRLENVSNRLDVNLREKRYLHVLLLKWTEYNQEKYQGQTCDRLQRNATQLQSNATQVLYQLQPHKDLKKLTIENYYGTIFPNWLSNGSISKLVSLHLIGGNCSSLPPLGQLSSLKELHLVKMKEVTEVRSEFCRRALSSSQPFRSLEVLKFEKMDAWTLFEVEEFLCLEELHLSECRKLTGNLPKNIPLLKRLYISECPQLKLDFLHESTDHLQYKALKSLHLISSCLSLASFPLGYFTKLEYLQIQDCSNLYFLDLSQNDLIFLRELKIQSCSNLKFSTDRMQLPASNLEVLSVLKCDNVDSMPREMHLLTSLQTLTVSQCPKLVSLPEDGLPTSLKSLSIKECNQQLKPQVEWGLRNMASLASFEIEGACSDMKSFPDGLLPTTLTHLRISGLPHLTSLHHLGLQNFTFLKELNILDCKELEFISEKQLPLSVDWLNITECPRIQQWCKERGDKWDRISHIPNINII